MGQVPQSKKKYGIVGDGRVARHISHYFNLLKIPFSPWSRGLSKERGLKVSELLQECDTVLVLISDSSIVPFILENEFLKTKKLIHFSGALVTNLAAGWHPLMTFGHELYDLKTYLSIPFIGEKGSAPLPQMIPELKNPSYFVAPEEKIFYHSLCVMSGNFTTLLWKKIFDEFENRFSIPRSAAFPYMEKIMSNVKDDPQSALTGPLNRRDEKTVQKNLDALEGDPFQEIYSSFVKVFFKNFNQDKKETEAHL